MKTLTASDKLAILRLASTLPVGSPERRAILGNFRTASLGDAMNENAALWKVYSEELLPAFEKKLAYLFARENPPKLVDVSIKRAEDFGDLERRGWSLYYPAILTASCTVELDFTEALFELLGGLKRAGFNGKLSEGDLEDHLYGEFPMGIPAFSGVKKFNLSTSEYEFRDFLQDKSVFSSDNPDYSMSNIEFDLVPADVDLEKVEWPKSSPLALVLTYKIEFKVLPGFSR